MTTHCKLVHKISVRVDGEITGSTLAAFTDYDKAKHFARRATELYRRDGIEHIDAVVTDHVEHIDYQTN